MADTYDLSSLLTITYPTRRLDISYCYQTCLLAEGVGFSFSVAQTEVREPSETALILFRHNVTVAQPLG